jgi:hypothetical protein
MRTLAAWRFTHNQVLKTKASRSGRKNLLEEIVLADQVGLNVFGIGENYNMNEAALAESNGISVSLVARWTTIPSQPSALWVHASMC